MTRAALEKAVDRLKNGDASAFDEIYDQTYKVVYFVAHGIVRNRQTAEDIVQDTYIAAFRNLDRYTSDNVLAWLTTIAKRLAINSYNRSKREVSTDFQENSSYFGEETMPDEDSFGLVKLAEENLSEIDFKILIMYAVAGYKRREIAQTLDMPVSTVSYRYSEAVKTLNKLINKGGAKQ